ncbi:DUF2975 domain-containing protein [Pandoraea sputorum]|uniref:DUF2975 domain-containing protein n=1 Tax=Pandoraea sputorum TaxID=93222 RepID=A0A5E5ASN4_9BURK|nr:DUF2975 domain-containing protein [Pandoraea sputorum]VVE75802.1 hypothetical protein PSP31121_00603 [Pandoraea sputorum]
MKTSRLVSRSQWMATVTLGLLFAMLLLNAGSWVFPGVPGAGVLLQNDLISNLGLDPRLFPRWQVALCIAVSSIPLIALAYGLVHLRKLFQLYAREEYFSADAAIHLGKAGRSAAMWVLLSVVSEPVLSIVATMREPEGQRVVTIGFGSPYVIALFLAVTISIVAHILRRASSLEQENKSFV